VHILTSIYFYSFFPHTVSLWNNLLYDVVSNVPFSIHSKNILEKKDVSQISEIMANVIYMTGSPLKYQYKAPNKADVNAICTLHLHEHKW